MFGPHPAPEDDVAERSTDRQYLYEHNPQDFDSESKLIRSILVHISKDHHLSKIFFQPESKFMQNMLSIHSSLNLSFEPEVACFCFKRNECFADSAPFKKESSHLVLF
jgi:hypothetical protein